MITKLEQSPDISRGRFPECNYQLIGSKYGKTILCCLKKPCACVGWVNV